MIEAATPRDEGALAVDRWIWNRTTDCSARINWGSPNETFAMQLEIFRRLGHGSQQYVRVEHVFVNSRGQAVIRNVKK
jgi:hypothetical protein